MTPAAILAIFLGYFVLLLIIAWLTTRGRNQNLQDFFLAGRRAPWYIVAYGMIGTSISGVTFISVPGAVRHDQLGYMQVVLGYLAGYLVIGLVLLPLYYRLQLTSIYTYLEQRLGYWGYKMGAAFFLLSRSLGSAVRLYLMALVLQFLIFDHFGVPFAVTVAVVLAQILLYTGRGGMKTILWTDTLQSTCLIGAVVVTLVVVARALGVQQLGATVATSGYGQVFFWDWQAPNHFIKEFLSGAFICIVMTGLDQSQMQKNLACKNLRQAQWNMASYSLALVAVNLFFLTLGVLLYLYAARFHIPLPAKADELYPLLAFHHFIPLVGVLFMLGLTAAAYSSADDAITALTTSFCVDLMGIQQLEGGQALRLRRWVHAGITVGIFAIIMLLRSVEQWQQADHSVIGLVLKFASFTYGPLLGMFAFGILTRRKVMGSVLPALCIASPLLCLLLDLYSESLFGGFKLGNGLIITLNGAIVFVGMLLASSPRGG